MSLQDNLLDTANDGNNADALPRSLLDDQSELEVGQIQMDLCNELFGFGPTAFTSHMVDTANEVIYTVIDKIDVECTKRWAQPPLSPEEQSQLSAEEITKQEARSHAVQMGVNRLETLLMAAVDLRFDQAEVYLLRNTFRVPKELIPYILLPHHPEEGFKPYLVKGEDDALMAELEQQMQSVNAQRDEIAILDVVYERQLRRLEALKAVKSKISEILPAGGTKDTLSTNSKTLAIHVPTLMLECQQLLATPSMPP